MLKMKREKNLQKGTTKLQEPGITCNSLLCPFTFSEIYFLLYAFTNNIVIIVDEHVIYHVRGDIDFGVLERKKEGKYLTLVGVVCNVKSI